MKIEFQGVGRNLVKASAGNWRRHPENKGSEFVVGPVRYNFIVSEDKGIVRKLFPQLRADVTLLSKNKMKKLVRHCKKNKILVNFVDGTKQNA
jgi:hypothetical protein